jgi:D-threo-aldose 1-dehydrogenase
MTGATTRRQPARRLGDSTVVVSRLGLGGAPLSGRFGPVPESRVRAVLDECFAQGITLVDTAAAYADGRAERDIGRYLRDRERSSYVISTKVRPAAVTGRPVRASVAESLTRLGCGHLDVVLLHDPYDVTDAQIRDDLAALGELRDEGLVRAVGIGIGDEEILRRIVDHGGIDCILLSGRYTLLDQTAGAGLLPSCAERGIGVIVGSVFNSGILASGPGHDARYEYTTDIPRPIEARALEIAALCRKYEVALPAAAVQFVLAHPAVTSVLIGTTNPAHLRHDLAHAATPLPGEFWHDLRDAGLVAPGSPLPEGW